MPPVVAEMIATLRNLRLLDETILNARVERLGDRITSESLIADLIQNNLLSTYQGDRLLEGNGLKLVLGSYRLIEPLGEGGMGHVFKAAQVRLNRYVALKVIAPHLIGDEQALQRFQREAQAAALLTHPNIVVIHDFDCDGPVWFLVMEYVEGTDLARLVKLRGTLGIREACVYIRQAAEGLQHAHEAGLIHRDIKPHNLLLTNPKDVSPKRSSSGAIALAAMLRTPAQQRSALVRNPEESVIKILDLGLARFAAAAGMATLTQDNALLGTPDFISPEQSRDPHSVDGRADIYSLGCTFYYLLAGQAPFAERSVVDKLVAHQTEQPTMIEHIRPQVPNVIAEILRKMMAKRVQHRYQSAREVVQALDQYLRSGSPTAGDTPPPARYPSRNEETPSDAKSNERTVAERVPIVLPEAVATGSVLQATHIPGYSPVAPSVATRIAPISAFQPLNTPPPPADSPVRVLQAHHGPITGLTFSPDGQFLASCATDDRIIIWKIDGNQITPLTQQSGGDLQAMQTIAFAPGNMQVAIGSSDLSGRVIIWQWNESRFVSTLSFSTNEKSNIAALDYSPDGSMLAVGVGAILSVWRLQEDKVRLRASLKGHRGAVRSVQFSPTLEGTLASGGEDGTARLWQLGRLWAGEKAAAIAHRGSVETISWCDDGNLLASGGLDQRIRIWDPINNPTVAARSVGRMDVVVRRIAWLGDGLVALGDRGQIIWWTQVGEPSSARHRCIEAGLTTINALSHQGQVAIGASNGRIYLLLPGLSSVPI